MKARPFTMNIELSFWMTKLLEVLAEEPNNRSIYWIWEPVGKAGKTYFHQWYKFNHRGDVLILSGKAADMKNGIMKYQE